MPMIWTCSTSKTKQNQDVKTVAQKIKLPYAYIYIYTHIYICNITTSYTSYTCVLHVHIIFYLPVPFWEGQNGRCYVSFGECKHCEINLHFTYIFSHITGWWFEPNWKIWVKLDHFPRNRDENKKYLKSPPRLDSSSQLSSQQSPWICQARKGFHLDHQHLQDRRASRCTGFFGTDS